MHVTFTRIASRAPRHHRSPPRRYARVRRGRCARREGENLCVRELCRAIRSLLPVRRRVWPAAG